MPALGLNVSSRFDNMLNDIAQSEDIAPGANNKYEVIRRAVALYNYLHTRVAEEKLKVALIKEDRSIVTVIDPLP